jgi:predicted nucleic acid-binding protein
MSSTPERIVVSNTSPLLYLHQVGHLELLTYTGTLGVLLKAKQAGLLPSVTPAIAALRETTMHLTQELIEMVLKEAGEG